MGGACSHKFEVAMIALEYYASTIIFIIFVEKYILSTSKSIVLLSRAIGDADEPVLCRMLASKGTL